MKFFATRFIASILFLILTLNAKAVNDTLTRAQVYNFNVGDTFDYRTVDDYAYYGIYNVSYGRVVVNDKYVSVNADTIIYGLNTHNLILTQLDSVEIMLQCRQDTMVACHYSFGTLSGTNIPTNSVSISGLPSTSYSYAKGLGEIYKGMSGYDMGFRSNYTELIYFSKDTVKWGTPYYILSSEEIRNPHSPFHLSPNPATDEITITAITGNHAPYDVYIYDIAGKCMLSHKNISQNVADMDVRFLPPGYYLLKLIDEHSFSSSKGFIISR